MNKNNLYQFRAIKRQQEKRKEAQVYNKMVKEMIDEFNRVLHSKK